MAEQTNKQQSVKKEKIPKNAEWLDLCAWVEREIFQYSSDVKLGTQASLVLSGLRHGQAQANNSLPMYGDYPYHIIKMSFIMYRTTILNALQGKEFDGQVAKMRYVCAILRDKIPEVYMRWLSTQKSQDKIETMQTDTLEYQGAEYTSKTETPTTQSKLDKKFEELW